MKLLVVESDGIQAEKMGSYLEKAGFRCEIYPLPEPALAAVTASYYDAVIFNLVSFSPEELDLLKYLRNSRLNKKTILTFEQNAAVSQNKVGSLGMASMQKPYPLQALHNSIDAVINYEHFEEDQTVFFNEIMIDVPGRVVRVKGQVIPLTRREYDLLLHLISNKANVLSKSSLAEYLANGNPATPEDFGFLYAHIKNLKRKLKAAGVADYIKTVYGVGYRFEA